MSNGINAIKGFDYQATVALSLLFDHFDRYGSLAQVRPEGIDDLDLLWTDGLSEYRRHIQIKKPREDNEGRRNPSAWTLSDVITELLPNTISHLSSNNAEQLWIVGDEFDDDVRSLVCSGENAPIAAAKPYWSVIHALARNDMLGAAKVEHSIRAKLFRWRIPKSLPGDAAVALSTIAGEFKRFVATLVPGNELADLYDQRMAQLHDRLPGILNRIQLLPEFGTEQEVAIRVYDRLEQRHSLQRPVIENTLFRNLRGFINDISKQPGRKFGQEEFELELRGVWPHMVPIRDAPSLNSDHVARPDLVERFTTRWIGNAIEAVGISGSGKTMLAGEVADQLRIVDSTRRVYYAEVRFNVGLRDVLVGAAFHLRRIGILEPFTVSVETGPGDEEALKRLAHTFSTIPQDILLLVDLVEGTCSDAFARDLATFSRALSSPACRIAVLGQESAFRELNSLEREEHGVSTLDIRGFRFEEFTKLVAHYHSDPDRGSLFEIYQRMTAGRAAGLFAKLAHSLARAESREEMSEMAARPADDILALAEQRRFARVSAGARSAAEKLVCFALPFGWKDAEQIFPDHNVGAAIRELLTRGLLRPHGQDSFEMHETVRAGLEGMIALNVRRCAHEALAAWYHRQGVLTAEILHLEKAGKVTEAQTCAREAFLRGDHWAALSPFVISHKLVSASETVRVIAGAKSVEDKYLLPSILRGLGESVAIDELFGMLEGQPERFFGDFQWSLAVTEAILEFDPARLHGLIVFSVEKASDSTQREGALGWLIIAARRKNGLIGPETIEFFNRQPAETKRMLLKVLLLDRRREAMRHVFEFLASDKDPAEGSHGSRIWRDFGLPIRNRRDTIEILAAMPAVKPAAMLAAKSALLGPLASLVWAQRTALRTHCIEIVRDATMEETVLENAIRVLVFLGEPSTCALCDPFLTRKDAVRGIAALVPALVPALCDRSRYETKVLDRTLTNADRMAALFVLASVGADLGHIRQKLQAGESDPLIVQGWDFWFLTLSAQAPFPDAIPLLEDFMKSPGEESVPIIVSALMRLGELPVPAATLMLIRAIHHSDSRVRLSTAIALGQRRSRAALASLIDQYARESVESLAVALATAIVASGPRSVEDLKGRYDSPEIELWHCVLAMRLRDATMAERLISIASDPTQNWQLRRAAISAAGRLPYEAALEKIVRVVMVERSPLTIDGNPSFLCHAVMSSILLSGAESLMSVFARGRVGFVDFFAEILETSWKRSMSREGLPSGAEAAGWLYDRLVCRGWPSRREAPDLVLNELSIPMLHSAVLRSLRLSGRAELIDEYLASADHVWFAIKCLRERSRAKRGEPDLASRLRILVEASPCKGNARLHRIIAEFADSSAKASPPAPATGQSQEPPPPASQLSYEDAVRVLSEVRGDLNLTSPVVLGETTAEQLERLIRSADPANDRDQGAESYIPSIQFTPNGHVVAQRRTTYRGESAHALIRPAIVAANKFGLSIPWHQELMTGASASIYVPKVLACLGALMDRDRFYEQLALYEDVLISHLCNAAQARPVLNYIDARIVPLLARYVSSGTDELFEGLCTLALRVKTPEIDTVLTGLFYRWTQRFDVRSADLQHDNNHALWRGFNRLAEHPRFADIDGWQSRLAAVLEAPMSWYHSENIVRVLERNPRSYILIESRLFKAMDWEHFRQDEIDRLDYAAERLFAEVRED